jgi:hypothetical protein
VAAQMTLRTSSALADLPAAAMGGIVPRTDIGASVALVVERAPFFFWCTTRSPPRTGSRAKGGQLHPLCGELTALSAHRGRTEAPEGGVPRRQETCMVAIMPMAVWSKSGSGRG